MATPAQEAKYNELKPMLESKGWDVAEAPSCCQMLVTLLGPRYIQVYVSIEGKIMLMSDFFAPWRGMVSQEAVDFLDNV